jgi:hypothetical protein
MRRSIGAKEKVIEQMQKSFDEVIEPRKDLLKSKKMAQETIVIRMYWLVLLPKQMYWLSFLEFEKGKIRRGGLISKQHSSHG